MNATQEHKEYVSRILTPLYNRSPQGRDSLYAAIKTRFPNISQRDVTYYLSNVEAHQLHLVRPQEKTSHRILADRPGQKFAIDLVDMQKLRIYNRQIRYWLTIIDIYSRYLIVIPLVNKTSNTVGLAYNRVVDRFHPTVTICDNGPEFNNIQGTKVIRTPPHMPQRNGIIERANGTIKRIVYEWMTRHGTRTYINNLNELVKSYNHKIHSFHGFKPVDVWVGRRDYTPKEIHPKRYRVLEVGQKVRINNDIIDQNFKTNAFVKKNYIPRWSQQLYTVKTRGQRQPYTYTLVEFGRKRFKEQDLLYVDEDQLIRNVREAQFNEPRRDYVIEPERPIAERRVRREVGPGRVYHRDYVY